MRWGSRKKKDWSFCTVYFVKGNFFNICVLSECIVYWIHFQNIHTFTYQKTLLHILLLLVSKIVESGRCIPKWDGLHKCSSLFYFQYSFIRLFRSYIRLYMRLDQVLFKVEVQFTFFSTLVTTVPFLVLNVG